MLARGRPASSFAWGKESDYLYVRETSVSSTDCEETVGICGWISGTVHDGTRNYCVSDKSKNNVQHRKQSGVVQGIIMG